MSLFNIKKIISWYLFLGSIFFLIKYMNAYGFLGILESLFPSIFVISIFLYFIYSSYIGIIARPGYSFIHLKISLLLQAIHFKILGISYENYFGPYFSIGFSDTPDIRFFSEFHLFWYHFLNGFDKNSSEISITINLVALILSIIVGLSDTKKINDSIQFDFDEKNQVE